ncbi:MAG: hypothetical protein HY744_13610 [Deltaproteobacteria bacterium]|nr:hypothetical protein [Deltaproteobacteria bacterium]
MSTRIALVGAVLVGAAFGAGCAETPNILVDQTFVGGRVVRMTIMPTGEGTEETGRLFNMYVRACEQKPDGTAAACKDTLVIENLVPASVY